MKLPSAQTTPNLPIRDRQAVTRSMPAMLTTPREKYIPEQTADQIARLYTTKANAKMSIASSWSGAFSAHADAQKKAKAAAQPALVDSQYLHGAQIYLNGMSGWIADEMVNGATEVQVLSDGSVTGVERAHPWEGMDQRYAVAADALLYGSVGPEGPKIGIVQANNMSKAAVNKLNKWRLTFDRQALEKIHKFQNDQKIDLASANYQEAMNEMRSIEQMTVLRDTMIQTGMDNKFAWDVWDKGVRRVNQEDVMQQINAFAIEAGHPDSKAGMDNFMALKTHIMGTISERGENELMLPEGARDEIHKSLMSIQTRMGELKEQRQDVRFSQLLDQYEKARLRGDVTALSILKKALAAPHARTDYGKNYNSIRQLAIGATESHVNNRDSDIALTNLIQSRAGMSPQMDSQIRREILEEYGAGRLSTTALNQKMGALQTRIQARRNANFNLAEGVLREFYVGGMSDERLEALLQTDAGMRKRAQFSAAVTRLTAHFRETQGDVDLLSFALNNLIGNRNVIKSWMRTANNKGIDLDDPDMEMLPLLSRVSVAATRQHIHREHTEALQDPNADHAAAHAVKEERLEELRSFELTLIYIQTFNGHVPQQDTDEMARDSIYNWISNPANRATILQGGQE